MPGDKGGGVGAEPDHRFSDFVGQAQAARGNRAGHDGGPGRIAGDGAAGSRELARHAAGGAGQEAAVVVSTTASGRGISLM